MVCVPTPAATGSKLYVIPFTSSVTPVPEYTLPVGVPPPSPACTPASIHKSIGATKFTTGKAYTSTSSDGELVQPFVSV